jgi:hypothetical protein
MRMAVLSLLALAGCAAQPQQPNILTPQEAQQMSAAELCLGLSTYGPRSTLAAGEELQRRGVNCQDHAQAIGMLQQQRAQAMGILMQNMNRPAYQYQPYNVPLYQTPAPVRCTSQWIGGQMQTVCR